MGKMSWESAKRELEISQKIQECIELSIGSYNNPYILTYSDRYMVNNETESNATGETTEVSFFPEGKKGVKLMYQLSHNIRKDKWQEYISLGVLASTYPEATGNDLLKLIEEFKREK